MTKRQIGQSALHRGQPEPTPVKHIHDEILAAARGLIQRYGFRKTTMEDIARAMGKERSSLYYYFPGKPELMKALIENEYAEITRAVRDGVSSQPDAASRFRTYLTVRIQQVLLRCAVNSQTLPELRNGGDGVPDIFSISEQRRAFDAVEERYVADILLQGIRDGQLRSLSEAKMMLFVRFAFSAMRGIELELILDPDRASDLMARLEVSCDIVMRGLLR